MRCSSMRSVASESISSSVMGLEEVGDSAAK
jgi:hypothetical protein